MDYLDPQKSAVAWLILIGVIAGVCLLLWLLNKALGKLGRKGTSRGSYGKQHAGSGAIGPPNRRACAHGEEAAQSDAS